ncbi:MAG: thioredoxin-like domain-containing protein [Bacteroidales bacterium]
MNHKYLVFIFLLTAIYSCREQKKVTVGGKLANPESGFVCLKRIDIDTPVPVDSVKIRSNGTFRLKIKTNLPEFYQLGVTGKGFITILAEPGERIKINFNSEFLPYDYNVSGSPGTQKLMHLDSALAVTLRKIDSLKVEYDSSYNKSGFDKKEKELNESYIKLLKDQRMFNISFILNNLNSFASIKALYQKVDNQTFVLYDSRDIQFLKLVADTLSYYYPDSRQVRALKANFEQEKNRFYMNQIEQLVGKAQERKLDPDLKDINGRRIALSSLKGKYVLLAFWSAASADCISENMDLKIFYNRYRDKGFEIYQINLDLNEDIWRKAVKFDELPWISVREDDPANPVNAILYNVKVLPANYLYDKNGEITASNLHGRALQIKLQQIFGF